MHKSDSDNVPHLIITNQGNHFASTYDPLAARLIAAAPELLAALKELLADKYLAAPINADRMAKTRAAIAKAERGVE
jgi:hypothetical protein